ncbi:hypothetical protein [Streptomyces sp. WMMB 322]|uniref:hypothetical protein n=1 Tax=Streptomyces sp. WMMB 322 TaxID=1286821 RepID=UPI0008239E74|nr:hypothetical protein [Streptomyces sp. WMMB 322]SCK14451.1 hypothetical protein H180DRAFT_00923 [Streptomyces sp. WMMB 322]
MSRRSSREDPARHLPIPWVKAADYGGTEDRLIDPAPLTRLLAAWSGTGGDELEAVSREVVQDSHDGPVHLVRLVASLETSARATGGTLSNVTDTPAVTGICGGTLHHLVEVLQSNGLGAATSAAGSLDIESRLLAVKALRRFWQAPLRALCEPLHDAQVLQPSRTLWRY